MGLLGNESLIDTLRVGSATIDTSRAGFKTLFGFAAGAAGNKASLRLTSGSGGTGYSPASAMVIRGFRAFTIGSAAEDVFIRILYTDNDLGFDSGGSLTNPVYYAADSSHRIVHLRGDSASERQKEIGGINFSIPSGKYATIIVNSTSLSAYFEAYAYEG